MTGDITASASWATENIAVRSVNDSLLRLWRGNGTTGSWSATNDSPIDGERAQGRPALSNYAELTAVRRP